jgi:hypothetical protein
MKWLIRNKETGLYLKNVWNWTNKVSDAFVFPNGLSLVEFCIRHQVPPMDMIPVGDGGGQRLCHQAVTM